MNKSDEIEEKIELRSEEFQDILGDTPSWILKWGIVTLTIVIIVILIGSTIFKYPDVISSTMILTGTNPPTSIVAKVSGKLDELCVNDNQMVSKGTYLAVIENAARTRDILALKEYINTTPIENDETFSLPPEELQLGNIQSLYSTFYITLFEYAEFKRLQYYSQKEDLINERILQYEIQHKNMLRQKKVSEDQLRIIHKQLQRDSLLNSKGLLSMEDLEKAESQYLQSVLSYEYICNTLENSRMQTIQMREQLLDTKYQNSDKETTLKSQIKTLTAQLQTELETWEMNNTLIAPINGVVTFTTYWVANQNITAGEVIFNILPNDKGEIIGKANLPIARSGKVKIGQKVNIRFDNYPDNEFGIVRGIVRNLSLVPSKGKDGSNYIVEIALPEDLRTSYNKELPYLPEMQAQAEIITEEISLIERFFMPIRKLIKESL